MANETNAFDEALMNICLLHISRRKALEMSIKDQKEQFLDAAIRCMLGYGLHDEMGIAYILDVTVSRVEKVKKALDEPSLEKI